MTHAADATLAALAAYFKAIEGLGLSHALVAAGVNAIILATK